VKAEEQRSKIYAKGSAKGSAKGFTKYTASTESCGINIAERCYWKMNFK